MKYIFLMLLVLNSLLASSDSQQNKVALLVANANDEENPLIYIENDLFDLEIFLKQKEFTVITVKDADKRKLIKALRSFSQEIERSDVALFYFAGHSVSLEGSNYLIPDESSIDEASEIANEAITLAQVINVMQTAHNKTNIMLLDLNIKSYKDIGDDSSMDQRNHLGDINNFNFYVNFTMAKSSLVPDFIHTFTQMSTKDRDNSLNLMKQKYKLLLNTPSPFVE